MKETHFGYKITHSGAELVCSYTELSEDKMLQLLKEVKEDDSHGLYWIFKQFGDNPKEPLCIIDCTHNRIYYHYSGDVESLDDAIKRLSH